jgi:hypothetical protein
LSYVTFKRWQILWLAHTNLALLAVAPVELKGRQWHRYLVDLQARRGNERHPLAFQKMTLLMPPLMSPVLYVQEQSPKNLRNLILEI